MKKDNNILIKIFSVKGKKYLYDARANFLGEINDQYLQLMENEQKLLSNNIFAGTIDNKSILYKGDFNEVVIKNDDLRTYIDFYFEHTLPRKLVLEVTEDCNLRCKYCFNTIGASKRHHSSKKLSPEAAIKAIDIYFEIYTKCFSHIPLSERKKYIKIAPPNLSWWGGEPLLNFELIKYTLSYFQQLPWGQYGISNDKIVYSIATNLTYLTEKQLSFLIENNVFVMVSLDGNESEHNLYRKDINGLGSFQKVKKNLDYLLLNFPDFCKKRIIIQAVFMKGHKLITDKNSFLYSYFHNDKGDSKVLKITQYPQKTIENFISDYWIKCMSPLRERVDYYIRELEQIKMYSKQELDNVLKNNDFLNEELRGVFLLEENLQFDSFIGTSKLSRSFACPLGRDVIYLSALGEFHICNKTDSSFPIGNVNEGISKQKVFELMTNFHQMIEPKCKKCWALRFCKMCPANIMHNNNFSTPTDQECQYLKELVEWDFCKLLLLMNDELLFERLRTIYIIHKDITFLDYSYPVIINF